MSNPVCSPRSSSPPTAPASWSSKPSGQNGNASHSAYHFGTNTTPPKTADHYDRLPVVVVLSFQLPEQRLMPHTHRSDNCDTPHSPSLPSYHFLNRDFA